MTKVVPAIIPRTKEQLEEEVRKVSSFANLVQVDISDGVFTPYKTWPYNGRDTEYFDNLKAENAGWPDWEDIDYEIHLMVKNPEEVISDWVHSGAVSIIGHIEATDNFQEVIDICKESLVSVGVAIKPSTDFDRLIPFVSQVDFVQVMGSDMLGHHGEELDESVLEKISKLHNEYPNLEIAVDIGVTEDTKDLLLNAGVTKLVSGSAILEATDPEESFRNLEE